MKEKRPLTGYHNATIYVADPDAWRDARRLARLEGLSLSALVGRLLAQYVRQHQPRKHSPLRLHDGTEE